MGGVKESKAEIHLGGRVAWGTESVTTEPDAVHRGRALVRTTGKVDLTVVVGYDADAPTRASLYVNGRRASVDRATASFDETDGRRSCLASIVIEVGALVVTDPDALEPILSKATYGTTALKALLAALPACLLCAKDRREDPEGYVGHETPWPATHEAAGFGPVCRFHTHAERTLVPLPYAAVIEAIGLRLRHPIFADREPEARTQERP
jgi:hypothetical protein